MLHQLQLIGDTIALNPNHWIIFHTLLPSYPCYYSFLLWYLHIMEPSTFSSCFWWGYKCKFQVICFASGIQVHPSPFLYIYLSQSTPILPLWTMYKVDEGIYCIIGTHKVLLGVIRYFWVSSGSPPRPLYTTYTHTLQNWPLLHTKWQIVICTLRFLIMG